MLRTFHPNFVRYPYGRRDLHRWFHPAGKPAAENEYSLTGFIKTQSLFVHIPKAAGTSVTQNLYGNLGGGHRAISEYQRLFQAGALRRMFTYTFVRNPWDRAFSGYRFLKAGGWPDSDRPYAETFLSDCDSFEQFVCEILPRDEAREKIHFHPINSFLKTLSDEWFPFDFVGRFERFQQDFEHVRLRVNPAAPSTHRNPTETNSANDYRSAYTPEMIDIVGGLYSEDVTALGYSFDSFEDVYPTERSA